MKLFPDDLNLDPYLLSHLTSTYTCESDHRTNA